jgi:hypothetical protein
MRKHIYCSVRILQAGKEGIELCFAHGPFMSRKTAAIGPPSASKGQLCVIVLSIVHPR